MASRALAIESIEEAAHEGELQVEKLQAFRDSFWAVVWQTQTW